MAVKEGRANPFDVAAGRIGATKAADAIVICSYQFAAGKAHDVAAVPWDLVVVDEAHRLRNVYKPENKTARTLRDALAHARKVLLTATPLQNTLLKLYGLVSFIDDRVFGDLDSFRQQFGALRDAQSFAALKQRIGPICKRTLRRQVEAYVKYTRRIPLLEEFRPGEDEVRLYDLVSEYLQRDRLYALPNAQRQLITLVLRKLLASSSFAIGGALESLVRRLKQTLEDRALESLTEELDTDYEALDETADEVAQEAADDIDTGHASTSQELAAIRTEIADLEGFRTLALSITDNAKGQSLLKALDVAFARLQVLGAARKAIIFTESRRTQEYLLSLLGRTEHGDGVVLFNGSNSDALSRRVYAEWMEQHRDSGRISGSRTADTRAALVDYFRERGKIMIATEAGAEGINLQLCSLVINYVPWNPQFAEEVQERLKVAQADATAALGHMERLLMRLTQGMLGQHAEFDATGHGFMLTSLPQGVSDVANAAATLAGGDAQGGSIPLGRYELPRRSEEAHVYRLQHPLAQSLIDLAKRAQTASSRVLLDYAAYGVKVTVLEALRGQQGQCAVQCLRVESLGTSEEYLLVAATCDGQVLDSDVAERLLAIPGGVEHAAAPAGPLSAMPQIDAIDAACPPHRAVADGKKSLRRPFAKAPPGGVTACADAAR